ncbi:hypothetical protein [Lihuaxuella thermophila]|nr:hypothetical protein [Lihuaxuella thermophila]
MLTKLCIQAYLQKQYFPLQTVCDVQSLKKEMEKNRYFRPQQRNITFTPEDGPVYEWVKSLESGYRSEEIKEILKETITQTLNLHPFRSGSGITNR